MAYKGVKKTGVTPGPTRGVKGCKKDWRYATRGSNGPVYK